jgi:enediyne biosynthesis protein E4
VKRLVLLFLLTSGCTYVVTGSPTPPGTMQPNPDPDPSPKPDPDPQTQPAPCHVAALSTPPACTTAVTRLEAPALQQNFLKDVFAFRNLNGKLGRRVTFGDVNGDRYPDLFAIETGVTPGLQHLYLNEAGTDGRMFNDATASSGVAKKADGTPNTALMVTLGDVDGDGDLDLFSGSYSQAPSGTKYVADTNLLYLNDGAGRFTPVTSSGVEAPWPLTTAAATFVDYDLDGKIDLFVGNFEKVYPNFEAYPNELYKGDGTGHFTRVNAATGMLMSSPLGDASGRYAKPTYGVTSCDVNNDGWPDLLTSSYALGANDLWLNQKDGTFALAPHAIGYDQDDQPMPGETPYRQGGNRFSASCGDYDNDGDLDIFDAATTHSDYPRNQADRSRILKNSQSTGVLRFERPALSETGINRDLAASGPNGDNGDEGDHGSSWLDFDHDGLLDLVIENSAYVGSHAWLYRQNVDHSFSNVIALSGVANSIGNSNGISVDDYDRDGDLDVVTGSVNTGSGMAPGGIEQLHLYENQLNGKAGFLYVTLKGTRSNRLGVGARVKLTAGCLTQTRELSGGKGTFGAQDPAYAHFGLGNATRIDRLEITWPSNPPHVQVLTDLQVNQFLEVTEDSDALWCEAPKR